jgi:prophage regulatory protein
MAIDRMLRIKEVAARIGVAKSTAWLWVQQGRLPRPTRLSRRCSVWRESIVEDFLRRAEAERGDIQ